jgi:hypothetical protein
MFVLCFCFSGVDFGVGGKGMGWEGMKGDALSFALEDFARAVLGVVGCAAAGFVVKGDDAVGEFTGGC